MGATDLGSWLEEGRKLGARAVEGVVESWTGNLLAVDRGRVSERATPGGGTVLFRAWGPTGGLGEATGELTAAPAVLREAVKRALSAPADPNNGPAVDVRTDTIGLGIDDRRYAQVTEEDRLELLVTAERSARLEDRRVSARGFRCVDRRTCRRLENTHGVRLEEWSTRFMAEGSVIVGADGGPVTVHEAIVGRAFATIASLPYGTRLGKRASLLLATPEAVEGPVTVLWWPRAVAALLEALGPEFGAARLRAEGSALGPLWRGTKRVDARLHLVDDGTTFGGLRTRAFDDEGVPPIPLTLLREGRIEAEWITRGVAQSRGGRATGHVWGQRVGPSNLMLRSGSRSVQAILTERGGTTLALEDFDPAWLDLATGDLNIVGPVVKMTGPAAVGAWPNLRLRGHVVEMLAQLVEIASDTDRIGAVDAPALLVNGLVAQ